jgi:4'-phosphopantetheinyl transferase
MCASVRECPPSGKSYDGFVGALAHLVQCVPVNDPAVDVWRMPLAVSPCELEQLAMLLAPDEQMRAARFHFSRDRSRYVAARGMLRVLLGNYLGAAPATIALESTPHGKPVLADPSIPLHFNLAHADDLAIYALARDCVPGVDIEHLDREVDHDALARRFFSAREYAELQRIPDADRNRAFLACWTCKEAVTKAVGRGLSMALERIEVTVCPHEPPRLIDMPEGDVREWALHRIDAGSAYVATLASYRPPRNPS